MKCYLELHVEYWNKGNNSVSSKVTTLISHRWPAWPAPVFSSFASYYADSQAHPARGSKGPLPFPRVGVCQSVWTLDLCTLMYDTSGAISVSTLYEMIHPMGEQRVFNGKAPPRSRTLSSGSFARACQDQGFPPLGRVGGRQWLPLLPWDRHHMLDASLVVFSLLPLALIYVLFDYLLNASIVLHL